MRLSSVRNVLSSGLGAFSALIVITSPGVAQQERAAALPLPNVIFTNPFGPIYEMFTAEYERRLNPSVSLGIAGTYWSSRLNDEIKQNSANVKIRFYPYELTPRGFSIGVSGGVTRIRGVDEDECIPADPNSCRRKTSTNPSFGVEVAHNWYMGPRQRFVLGSGLGVKRLFGNVVGESEILPMFRFNIGYAF